ncbi:membrane protein DedA, SNARE-associated domain [Streptomyces sp. DvalAA-14]|uniref:DedA family protein n=1 Tax=unclassified Streptomyces TaxID=2593676 RepID=UPI00081B18C9|nr:MULTISPECIES: DedA family protein [unclassified Streptomyces]SCE35033.1 membrane protein DedA, SNARE-associated domain [Streptomyces sp. DvalAA-14]
MHTITDWLSRTTGGAVYAVIFALVFCEDALFFGFVLPGETAAVLGGVLAGQHKVSVYWMAVLVVLAAVGGDSVGYEVGRRFGPRILDTRALRGRRSHIDRAQDLIRRRGPTAVFLGRFIAFFRALIPSLAGISRMPYRVFLLYNALGGLVWGVGFVLLGYFAGDAYQRVERTAGTAVAAIVAAVVVAALVVWEVRRRRRGHEDGKDGGGPNGGGPNAGDGNGNDGDRHDSDSDDADSDDGASHDADSDDGASHDADSDDGDGGRGGDSHR